MQASIAGPAPVPLTAAFPDWRAALGAHYARLSKASRRKRFHASLADQGLHTIVQKTTPARVLGLVHQGRVIGVVEIYRSTGDHVEIGISVEDAFQGRGFGRRLFAAGLDAARDLGAASADVHFSHDNSGIRALVIAAGGTVTYRDGDCCAEIAIRPQG